MAKQIAQSVKRQGSRRMGKYEDEQAMPQAKFGKFRFFKNIAPGFALRLRPRANKNLHMPSGYPPGNLLHNICPQGSFMQIFNRLRPQASPQAMPQGK
ncbi:hypothetical protein T06_11360 [Trichinella sp. T6]|nr:hypothetical protein T06_11360 [Trichinella sp. T6]